MRSDLDARGVYDDLPERSRWRRRLGVLAAGFLILTLEHVGGGW